MGIERLKFSEVHVILKPLVIRIEDVGYSAFIDFWLLALFSG